MSEWSIQEIDANQEKEWDCFVEESPQGSLFATSTWKKITEKGTPHRFRIYAAREKDRIRGGVVFLEKSQLGRLVALNPLLCPYPGFILPKVETSKISDQLSKEHEAEKRLITFLEERYAQIDFHNAPELNDVRAFNQKGWKSVPRYSYHLDVSDPDALWERLDGSTRRAIKKAGRSDLNIIADDCSPQEIHDLLNQTLTRHGDKNPIPASLVGEVVSSDNLKTNRKILAARTPEGKPASVIVCVWDWKRAYYLLAASESEHIKTGINSLLIWEMAKLLSKLPIKEFDFIGANIPTIARFKENFNPILVTYYRLEKWPSFSFRLLKSAGRILLRR